MWLRLLHTIGLTNLTDEQVNRYYAERLGQISSASPGLGSLPSQPSLAELLRVTLAMAVLAVALAANWAQLSEPHIGHLLGMIAGLLLVVVPWIVLTTAAREEIRLLEVQFGRREEQLEQEFQRLMEEDSRILREQQEQLDQETQSFRELDQKLQWLMEEIASQRAKIAEQAERERELRRQFEELQHKAS